jgi:uncharacterized protein DUF6221
VSATVDDLVVWLREQLEADEWLFNHWPGDRATKVATRDGLNIACWDPTRGLAEVQSKRAILDAYDNSNDAEFPDFDGGYASGLEDSIRAIAQVYADCRGFRDEWKPTEPRMLRQ